MGRGVLSMLRIVVVEPGRKPYATEIEHELHAMQKLVGGTIQGLSPFDDEVMLVANDEGKLLDMPLNRTLKDADGQIYDILAGTFFICGAPAGDSDMTSLTQEQVDRYMELFHAPEVFLEINGYTVAFHLE